VNYDVSAMPINEPEQKYK